ncbi:MAG: AAA family ATPase [Phycisphaerae bacterium]|nr:AAA family ATPase [Phycisphaerae bacterium]
MLKNAKIRNLRAIKELDIEDFGQVNLIVGKNGSAKTTFLEALLYACGAQNPSLTVNTNAMRGLKYFSDESWPTFFRNMDFSNKIEIKVSTTDDVNHRLNILPYFQAGQSNRQSEIDKIVSTSGHSVLHSSFPFSQNVNGLEFLYACSDNPDALHSSKIYREGEKLKTPDEKKEPVINAIFIGSSAEMDWKQQFGPVQRKKQVQEVVNLLKEIDQRIEDIALNEIGLLEVDLGLPNFIPANLLGGGISRFLSIALAMLNFRVVLIDEIENGLHHSSQRKIWNAVFSWAQKVDVQVFATTHSWEAIQAFHAASQENLFTDNSRLFRIERENGKCKCVKFTQQELDTSINNKWEIR